MIGRRLKRTSSLLVILAISSLIIMQFGSVMTTSGMEGLKDVEGAQGWQGPQRISDGGSADLQELDLASNSNGEAVAAWIERGQDSIGHIFVSIYDPETGWTTPRAMETPSDFDADQPLVGIDGEGRVLATWGMRNNYQNDRTIWYSVYEKTGGWSDAALLVKGTEADLAISPDGKGFFIYCQDWQVWAMTYDPISGFGIGYSVDGSPGAVSNDPHIMLNATGGALLIWTEQSYPTTPEHIYQSKYSPGTGWTPGDLLTLYDAYDPATGSDGQEGAAVIWTTIWYTYQLRVQTMTDGVWSDYVLLFERPEDCIRAHQVAIDDSGDAMAVWAVQNGSQMEIWWSFQQSGGIWSSPLRMESDLLLHHQEDEYSGSGNAYDPKLVIDSDGTVTLLWFLEEQDHYHLVSDRYYPGQGWRGTELIGECDASPHELELSLAGPGNVSVAWGSFGSAFSNCFVSLPGAPGAPRELKTNSSDGEVALNWKAPFDDGGSPIVGYKLYRDDGDQVLSFLLSLSSLQYTDQGLENGREYVYRVAAINAMGEGVKSFLAIGTPSSQLPGPPMDLYATLHIVDATLSWKPPLDPGDSPLVGYRIYRAKGEGGMQVLNETQSLSYVDGDLAEGENFTYQVKAYSNAGEGDGSSLVTVSVPAGAKLMPTDVRAEGQPLAIYIAWEQPMDYMGWGTVGYKVYRGLTPDNVTMIYSTPEPWVMQYSDEAISAGVEYYYRVSVVFVVGDERVDGPQSLAVSNHTTQAYINVTSPQEFEPWSQGTRHDIKWVSGNGAGGPVDIALVFDPGYGVITPIATGEENDGLYTWDIPRDQPDGLRIKVSLTSNPSVFGVSQIFFIGPYAEEPLNTTAELVGPLGTGGWFVGSVQAQLNASGYRDGLYAFETWYRLDGGTWASYEEGAVLNIEDEGLHSLEYYSIDSVRHVEQTRSTTIPIDKSAPTVQFLNPPWPGKPFNSLSIRIEWRDGDSISGISERMVRIDDGAWESAGDNTNITVVITEGYHEVEINLTDEAGIRTFKSTNLTVDVTPPQIISCSPNGNGVAISVIPEIVFSEPMNQLSVQVSGLYVVQKWDGERLVLRPSSYLLHSTTYTLVVSGKDLAGNDIENGSYAWSFTTLIRFEGEIINSAGEPIDNATVEILEGKVIILTLKTSSSGNFLAYLAKGNYTVQVESDGLTPWTGNVTLAPDSENHLQVRLVADNPSEELPWLTIILVVIAIVIIGAVGLAFWRRKLEP